ncbi:MAG: hypothetical protein RL030_1750 [Pseudomonadota bacterium]|jgi:hypothetical protein
MIITFAPEDFDSVVPDSWPEQTREDYERGEIDSAQSELARAAAVKKYNPGSGCAPV